MPVFALTPVATAFWGAVGAGATAGAQVYGAHKQAGAQREATAAQSQANAAAIAEQQRQDAMQKEEFDRQQAMAKAQWDAEQAIRAPYRAAGAQALSSLGDLLGTPFQLGVNAPTYAAPAYTPPTLPSSSTAPTSTSTLPSANALGDPSTWMGLVGNTPALTDWVRQGLGPKASADLVNYYVGKIKGQPGANPTEQAGSANYWLQKLRSDPNVTGQSSASTLPRATMPPTSLAPFLTPSTVSGNAFAPSYAPVIPISQLYGGA